MKGHPLPSQSFVGRSFADLLHAARSLEHPERDAAARELDRRLRSVVAVELAGIVRSPDELEDLVADLRLGLLTRKRVPKRMNTRFLQRLARWMATDRWRHDQAQLHGRVVASLDGVVDAPHEGKSSPRQIAITDHPNAQVPSPEEEILARIEMAHLLTQLPPPQARVVSRRIRQVEYPEIAIELGISEANARQLASRGFRKLRELMEGSQ